MKHELQVLDHTGHTTHTWDPEMVAEIDEIEAKFNELKDTRLMYRVDSGEMTQMHTFDKSAPEIIAVPAPVGG